MSHSRSRSRGWSWLRFFNLVSGVLDPVPSAAESTFTLDDYDIPADGTTAVTPTIVVRNAAGIVIPGKVVTLTVETIAVSAANTMVTAAPAEILNNGVASSVISVAVRDASNRAIPDIPASDVVLACSGTGNTVTQPTGSTNALGVITGSVVSTVAEAKTASATVRSTAITDTASVTATATPAAASFSNLEAIAGLTVLAELNNPASINPTDFYVDGNTPATQDPSDTGAGIGVGTRSRVTTGYTGTPAIGGSAVIRGHFESGDAGGSGQGRMTFDAPDLTEFGVGIEHQWATAYPHSDNSNKNWFTIWGGGERLYVSYRVRSDLSYSRMYRFSFDGGWPAPYGGTQVNGTVTLTENAWEKVEWYVKKDLAANTAGIVKLWVGGVLAIDLTDVVFPALPCNSVYDEGENNGMYTQESPSARVIGHSETDAGGSSGAPAADANNAAANRYLAVLKVYS